MTKAKSKSAKLKAKRGRPRAINVLREPNGRRSRALTPKVPADKLAIAMRAKHMGLSLDQARDPRAATYLGRLNILGEISQDQYNAAVKFLEVYENYKKAIQSPAAYYDHHNSIEDSERFEDFCVQAKNRYSAATTAVKEAQFDNSSENLYGALQYVVIGDLELPYMVGTTRILLNALARHFFLAK